MLGYPGLLQETDTIPSNQQIWFKGCVWVASSDSHEGWSPTNLNPPTGLLPVSPQASTGNKAQKEPGDTKPDLCDLKRGVVCILVQSVKLVNGFQRVYQSLVAMRTQEAINA